MSQGREHYWWTMSARVVLVLATALWGGFWYFSSRQEAAEAEAAAQAWRLVVDPATVDARVLGALPGMGPGRVEALKAARDEGPFQSLEDLDRRVAGVGPATIQRLKTHLRVGGSNTVSSIAGPEQGGGP